MFRIYEYLLTAPANDPYIVKISNAIKGGMKLMIDNGFEKLVVEDFCDLAVSTLDRILKKTLGLDGL